MAVDTLSVPGPEVIAALAQTRFGFGDHGREGLVSGWSTEKKRTWSVGTESVLRLTCPPPTGDLQIELNLMPFTVAPWLRSQRIAVSVNGHRFGTEHLSGATWLGFRLPDGDFNQGGDLLVQFHCPDAATPASLGAGHPAGTVHALARDLFCGSMDNVEKGAEEGERPGRKTWLSDAALTAWMSVCANAYRLWREEGARSPSARSVPSQGGERTRLHADV